MVRNRRLGASGRTKRNQTFDDDDDSMGSKNVRKWYQEMPEDPDDFKSLPESEVNLLRNEARVVLENDTLHHRNKFAKGSNRSNNEWLQTMVSKGTFQDKIAASVVLLQNSPLYGHGILKNLVNLVNVSKRECMKVMDVLTDLFTSDLLVPNKKLRPFGKRPLSLLEQLSEGNLVKRKECLSLWFYEDLLKSEYQNFVRAIGDVGRDTVDSNREKSIMVMGKLLTANPEQEVLLLSSLVNKIGDPSGRVASKASRCLEKVLVEHPNMKTVVMEEIEKLLFRPNIRPRAQYYGICFLSQYIFTKGDDDELASRLIQLYFSFFKGCIKKGDVDSRIMRVLLIGVNRAFPFAKKENLNLKEHIDTMYRIVHIAQFNVSLHTLCLLFQVSDYDTSVSDRFYSVLYKKLLDPGLSGSHDHAIFISLVFRAMSKDIQFSRIKVFIKRLLQICHFVPVSLACGILVMISHLFKEFPNLLSLALIATDFKEKEDEESDGEYYYDTKLQEVEEKKTPSPSDQASILAGWQEEKQPITEAPSWYHISNLKAASRKHLAFARNPLFLSGELNVYTELVSLVTHFHPTVSFFASHLLEGKNIQYSGDPLGDFTLARFLDRWVFKNPKKNDNTQTVSKFSRKVNCCDVKSLSVNSEEYLNAAENAIPSEEMFMYRFFKKYQAERKQSKEIEDDSDVSSVASDEFEGMLGQLLGGKEEIDYAEGISQLPSETEKRKQQKRRGASEDSASSEDELNEEATSDISDGDSIVDSDEKDEDNDDIDYERIKEEFSDMDELDDDEDAITFDDNSEEDFLFTMSDVEQDEQDNKSKRNKKAPTLKAKKLKKGKGMDSRVFVPAEEFAQMLEDTGEERARFGHVANVSNRDNASMKQLKWEMARNQRIGNRPEKRKQHGNYRRKPTKKFKK